MFVTLPLRTIMLFNDAQGMMMIIINNLVVSDLLPLSSPDIILIIYDLLSSSSRGMLNVRFFVDQPERSCFNTDMTKH